MSSWEFPYALPLSRFSGSFLKIMDSDSLGIRGVFMLQMSKYFCEIHVDGRSKNNIFASNYLECKTKSVCFDEKHANFRVKHTNS